MDKHSNAGHESRYGAPPLCLAHSPRQNAPTTSFTTPIPTTHVEPVKPTSFGPQKNRPGEPSPEHQPTRPEHELHPQSVRPCRCSRPSNTNNSNNAHKDSAPYAAVEPSLRDPLISYQQPSCAYASPFSPTLPPPSSPKHDTHADWLRTPRRSDRQLRETTKMRNDQSISLPHF
ncbi:hypothetical protein B0I37DRAFT_147488 [Chaetomium sp. MPI-CAGE-AT-0009]|nr:hypothetical protein B0I37DRAFT_147488 [Chaetomium sp. MPI-CAGE-AT-0009]